VNTNADYIEARRAEILDGKTSWGIDLCGGDKNVFLDQYVKPLRHLRGMGQLFDDLEEVPYSPDGSLPYTVKVEIVGGRRIR